jgi:hypothetical protein
MPTYLPKPEELQQLFDATLRAKQLDLQGELLIGQIDKLASSENLGFALPVIDELEKDLKSRALAIALVLARPSRSWSGQVARRELQEIAVDLLPVWEDPAHTDRQKLRKTVDHVLVFGAHKDWPCALEVIFYWILSAVEASLRFVAGLIPDLEECWGDPITLDAPLLASLIQDRLLQSARRDHLSPGDSLQFSVTPECVDIDPLFQEILPGCRRNFKILDGEATLSAGDNFNHPVSAGQRLIVRASDEGEAAIQLAHVVPGSSGGSIGGPICGLRRGQFATLKALQHSTYEAFSCTCGTWQCDVRHRLTGWSPSILPPSASLRTFLWTAAKGPIAGFKLKGFVTGMLYALLCEGL